MELKDFIGKVVLRGEAKKRYLIYEITAPEIKIVSERPEQDGHYTFYVYPTINGDPISNGYLEFENPTFKDPFIKAYDAYSRTEDAFWEEYGYWMMRE